MRDWKQYLHTLREREFRLIFSRFPQKMFENVLELGAGDGYQTSLLLPYTKHITSSDYLIDNIKKIDNPRISYQKIDAEEMASLFFPDQKFDLIYSSNLLEHLAHPDRCLRSIYDLLSPCGVTIHSMPNVFWKMCQIMFYHIHLGMKMVAMFKILISRGRQALWQNICGHQEKHFSNNPKIQQSVSLWRTLLGPSPHGSYSSHMSEFLGYSKKRWSEEFQKQGFVLLVVLKGPVSSGYGFGLARVARLLEHIGLCSEYVYIAVKKEGVEHYMRYFKLSV